MIGRRLVMTLWVLWSLPLVQVVVAQNRLTARLRQQIYGRCQRIVVAGNSYSPIPMDTAPVADSTGLGQEPL